MTLIKAAPVVTHPSHLVQSKHIFSVVKYYNC